MAFLRLFSDPKKGDSSSKRNGTNASPVITLRTDIRSKYSGYQSSYTSTCNKDSDLRSFDSLLRQRTKRFVSVLAADGETQSLSLDSHMEVCGILLELSQDAVRVIIDSKEDVWKNKQLKSLVDVYFKSTAKTLDFFNTIENCVKRTEISRLIIRFAVKQFETESVDTDHGANKKKKYAKTLEELNKFKAMGDPFDGEFVTQYKSVYEEQVLLLEEFRKLKVKLDKKQRNAKIWRTLSNVVFATAYVSVLILSVVLAAMSAVPVVGAVASALTSPAEFVGKWCSDMWKEYDKAVKRQKGLVILMESRTRVDNEATNTIRILVDNLRIRISSILQPVEFAVEREEEEMATKDAMEVIKKKVESFTAKIEEVGENANSSLWGDF